MIYFDAAATSFQKPASVGRAVAEAMAAMSSPGRGGYPTAQMADRTLVECREELAQLFQVPDPESVVFTSNATHGLNIAIRSLVKPGSRVVLSGYEHNAVTRPLYAIPGVKLHVVNTPLFQPEEMLRGFSKLITADTTAVVCTHVSNVFGYVLPIGEISALCRERGVPLIVDASQSAGILPVDFAAWQAAFVAMPGHKGLYGPQGTGVLLCGVPTEPLLRGGTGSNSKEQEMPEFLPDRLEAGTHNMPGVAGLLAGVRFVRKLGIQRIRDHEWRLKEQLLTFLEGRQDFRVYGCHDEALQAGVLSFAPVEGDCESLCDRLAEEGFALRSGFHCAPFAHRTAGTIQGGTIRFSASAFNSQRETAALCHALGRGGTTKTRGEKFTIS